MGWRGHQLCLPAGPNTLGFFATEDLTVHPTRSPRPKGQPATQTNRNTQKKTIKKKKRRRSKVVKSYLGMVSEKPLSCGSGVEGDETRQVEKG